MSLNRSNGNMYEFITHTWNMIKGKCFHDCSYCYMKTLDPIGRKAYFDEREYKTDLGKDNFIFVGSSIDLFADDIPSDWINECLDKCYEANNNIFGDYNQYLFQSKNPRRFLEFKNHPVFKYSILCTTIETNRYYPEHMGNCPTIEDRVLAMEEIASMGIKTFVTIEPIMDFDLDEMVECIRRCHPIQVNLGRESKRKVEIPEPKDNLKVELLVEEILKFTNVVIKKNALLNGTKDLILDSYKSTKNMEF